MVVRGMALINVLLILSVQSVYTGQTLLDLANLLKHMRKKQSAPIDH